MPNWVSNSLIVTSNGDVAHAEMKEFLSLVGKDVPQGWLNEKQDELHYDNNGGFSFLAFVSPPADKIEEYYGRRGVIDGEEVGDTEYNWYNWNLSKWGCKWDCSDVYVHSDIESDPTEFHASFQTPWSPPEEFLKTLIDLYPNLDFTLEWEEEQGFGAIWESSDIDGEERSIVVTKEWDIPHSHADYVERDRECQCEWDDDPNDWYEDCPDRAEEILRWNKENGIIDPNAQEPDLVYG